MHKLRLYVGSVVGYPLARDFLFHVCDKVNVRLLRYAHIRVLGHPFKGYDLAAFPLESGFDARAAAVEGFGYVYSCLNVRRATLQGGKLYCPCLYAVLFRNLAGKVSCGARKLFMTESVDVIHVVAELANVSSVSNLDPLRNGYNDGALLF